MCGANVNLVETTQTPRFALALQFRAALISARFMASSFGSSFGSLIFGIEMMVTFHTVLVIVIFTFSPTKWVVSSLQLIAPCCPSTQPQLAPKLGR